MLRHGWQSACSGIGGPQMGEFIDIFLVGPLIGLLIGSTIADHLFVIIIALPSISQLRRLPSISQLSRLPSINQLLSFA